METKVVRFMPHGVDSPEVLARVARGDEIPNKRLLRINIRTQHVRQRLNSQVEALTRSKRNLSYKIPAFWQIVDELMSFNRDDVACKKGCSHCCHIPALMPSVEAEVVGNRIGYKPRVVYGRHNAQGVPWGYDHPCTFLVDGECSIYENRPTVCRVQVSLDTDALMCELTPPESKNVPLMNTLPMQVSFLRMLGFTEPDQFRLGLITEFWPNE